MPGPQRSSGAELLPPNETGLDADLRAAQARGDGRALIGLYQQAAEMRPAQAPIFLTHAYVHALDTGSDEAAPLRARLVALGAEPEV